MALYDIGRDNWDNYRMSYHTYLAWMKNSLSLDANFVIYTETKFAEEIKTMRVEFDPTLERTVIIERPLEELECYKLYHEPLTVLMGSNEFKNKIGFKVPEMEHPLYNIIMFNKLSFIKDAIERNDFNGDYCLWLDAGGLRDDVANYKNIIWPNINSLPQDKITFFSHVDDFDINSNNYEYHSMSQIRYIQGTAFGVPNDMLNMLICEFHNTIDNCISKGYIGSDEKIFDLTYLRIKEYCNLIKCTWRQYFDILRIKSKVVVAKYKEDISWIDNLKSPVIVYNKNISDNKLFDKNLPNIGREGHTFFTYIVEHYDNLPDYIIFLQGYPFDHCNEIINKINNFKYDSDFYPLGHVYIRNNNEIVNRVIFYSKIINVDVIQPIIFISGGQCIVSKKLILKRDKESYLKIIESYQNTNIYDIHYLIEYLFPTILNFNQDLEEYL